jgi:hypothetical protein
MTESTDEQGGTVYPMFVFSRQHDIELETGLLLAGWLLVDLPRKKKPKRRHQQMIVEIVRLLTDAASSGQMPTDALVYGWHGGHKPANAVDTDDDARMAAWAKDRISMSVRIDPRNDGLMRIDSDMLRQMGLASSAPVKKQ